MQMWATFLQALIGFFDVGENVAFFGFAFVGGFYFRFFDVGVVVSHLVHQNLASFLRRNEGVVLFVHSGDTVNVAKFLNAFAGFTRNG